MIKNRALGGRTFYLPMEVFARERHGKMALATKLVSRGHKVVIGSNHIVRSLALQDRGNSCYYEIKGQSPSGMDYLYQMKSNGMIISGQDEEAGISYSNFNDFKKFRPEVENLALYEVFYSWGKPDHDALTSSNPNANILQTGSPRSVFWGPLGKKYFEPEIKLIRESNSNYILVISNTTIVNSILNRRENHRVSNAHGYLKDYHNAFEVRKIWEVEAHKRTIETIESILKLTNFKVILRTHPVENVEQWRQLFGGNPRVKLVSEGPITPLIYAANAVIHAGSTAGMESIIAEKKTISIEGLIQAPNFKMKATEMSLCPKSIEELVENLIDEKLNIELAEEVLRNSISNWKDLTAVTMQCDSLESLEKTESKIEIPTSKNPKLSTRIYNRLIYGKSDYMTIHNKKRPLISLSQMQIDILRVSELMEVEKGINVKMLGESTFKLEQN